MNIMKTLAVGAIGAMAVVLSGCDPDKFGVSLPVSAINKAVAGGVGTAKVKAFYKTSQDDIKQKLPQIKAVLQSRLGEKAKIDLAIPPKGDATLSVAWRIPVVDHANVAKVSGKPVLGLVLDGTWLTFMTLSGLEPLNADLNRINSGIDASFMCDMEFIVNNDTEEDYTFLVCGAFVDEQPHVYNNVKLASEDSTTVLFKRKDDASVFHFRNPCLGIWKKQ